MEITDIHDEYLKLTKQYEFILTHRRIKDDFPSFMKLYNIMDIHGIGEHDVLNLVQLSNDIKSLYDYYDETLKDVNNILIEKQNKIKELNNLDKKIEDAKQILDSLDLEIKLKRYMSSTPFELKEKD